MEANQAAENLQVIRTLMERSAVYRRALAPIMTLCGVLGIGAGILGWQLKFSSGQSFVFWWAGTAAVAFAGSLFLVRRQALRDSEPFWSPPTRRIAQAMTPPFFLGLVIGILMTQTDIDAVQQIGLVMIWTALYGCALHSAGFFISRGVRILGWIYCVFSCLVLLALLAWAGKDLDPHLLMGGLFGGLHLLAGIYLYLTEKQRNES